METRPGRSTAHLVRGVALLAGARLRRWWRPGVAGHCDILIRPLPAHGRTAASRVAELRWRHDQAGQAGLRLPGSDTEIVLTTQEAYEPNWLVASADHAAAVIGAAGGRVVTEPFDIPVGRVAVVADPFGNTLVLLDLSKGHYVTDDAGNVTAVVP